MCKYTNCSCPICVPTKIYQQKHTEDATTGSVYLETSSADTLVIECKEYDRLKRLDENIKLALEIATKNYEIFKNLYGKHDRSTLYFRQQKVLLESLLK